LSFIGIELFDDSTGLWMYTILPFLNGILFLIVYYKKLELSKLFKISYWITLVPVILFFFGTISTIQRCTPSSSQMGCIFPLILALILLSCCSLVSIILTITFLIKRQ
jgi:hypothetical protein